MPVYMYHIQEELAWKLEMSPGQNLQGSRKSLKDVLQGPCDPICIFYKDLSGCSVQNYLEEGKKGCIKQLECYYSIPGAM